MIHLVGLPHTQFDADKFSHCAFTAKAVRTAKMIRDTGREVAVYWGDSLMGADWQARNFPAYAASDLPPIIWDYKLPYWREFNQRCLLAVQELIKPGDIIAVVGGSISQEIVDHFKNDYTCIEPGVGYEGICQDTFACFESYAWMHNRYGAYGIGNGRAFDAVIPNAVDPDKWSMAKSEGYALFVGRMIARKGPHVAAEIANAAGLHCKFAGGGVAEYVEGHITCEDGTQVTGDISYVGAVQGKDREMLFAHAEVFICPTLYIGPWEGVHAEALMSGVGVVAPDYGVFTETLDPAFRYRTMSQAVAAVDEARRYRGGFREPAINLCGIERCTEMYDEWLDRIESLRDGRNGWYG